MQKSDNKRIAKNTLFLYFRMIVVLGVTLYTSRVVLQTLGVDDFGIYNIIGGIVILFSFMKSSVTTAVQRYLNYALGKDDERYEQDVYSSSFLILGSLTLLLVVLLETVGLWFVNSKLSIPPDRMSDANIVYQLSVLCFAISTFRIPLDALVMAHERMSFYAYISIFETILKLGIAFMLMLVPANKLILYASLVLAVTLIVNAVYHFYCHRNFPLRVSFKNNPKVVKELMSFSGWNVFGSVADIGYQQGTNIVLNIFYGVAFNASMGIANQVKNATFTFIRNILVAANPQIFKTHSAGMLAEFASLVLRMSKFAYLLVLLVALPLIFNMEYILELWLGDLPPMCYEFCVLTIIFCIFDSLVGPLWTAAQAEGHIKKYQIITSCILLMNLPLTYLAYHFGAEPYALLQIQIVIVIISLIYRVTYLSSLKLIKLADYVREVLMSSAATTVVTLSLCILINHLIPEAGFRRLLINTPLYVLISLLGIWFIGVNRSERKAITEFITKKIKR
ncbi:MAG: hypothetical protein UH625_08595 [Muribaculaceae bacterium]|nr:hypothetical protein [Muribaculaceae bacterium]